MGSLESRGFELAIVPIETGEEAETSAYMAEGVSGDKGLEVEAYKVIDVDRGNEEVPRCQMKDIEAQVPKSSEASTTSVQKPGEAETSTTTINFSPSPAFVVNHLFSSPITQTPTSPYFYLYYRPSKSTIYFLRIKSWPLKGVYPTKA